VALSACCFGSIPIFITIANNTGAPLVTTLAWRYLLAALLLVLISGPAQVLRARGRGLRLLVLAGGGQALIGYVSLSALRFIPAATLTFLFYTYPAWVAVIALVRRTETLTTRRLGALALSLIGVIAMVGSPRSTGLHPMGIGLALGAAFIYAAYIPMIDTLRGDLPATVTAAFASGGAALVLLIAGLATGVLTVHLEPTAWQSIAALAVVSTTVAFVAFLRGLAQLGPVRTAIVSTIEPFWTAILGVVVLSQPLGIGTVIGGAMIAAAVVLLQW
jgi:drug/metabolite transporter (DMT)-like permease